MERPSVRLTEGRSETGDGVLIHDGECPFCSAAATANRRIPGVGSIAHAGGPAQRFLAAQFDDVPLPNGARDAFEDLADAARCMRLVVPE